MMLSTERQAWRNDANESFLSRYLADRVEICAHRLTAATPGVSALVSGLVGFGITAAS